MAVGEPLVRRRLINILDVLEGDVDHDDMDTDEVIARAGVYGCFVNEITLEPELFTGGLAEAMQSVIERELSLAQVTLDRIQAWVDDTDQLDIARLLKLIERIGKGGSPRRWQLRCRRMFVRITFAKHWSISAMPLRSVSAAYLAQAAELAGNPGQLAAYESRGHCVVLAGPGSGKTKTLVLKLARIRPRMFRLHVARHVSHIAKNVLAS